MKVSVCVTVLNEEETISDLINYIRSYNDSLKDINKLIYDDIKLIRDILTSAIGS